MDTRKTHTSHDMTAAWKQWTLVHRSRRVLQQTLWTFIPFQNNKTPFTGLVISCEVIHELLDPFIRRVGYWIYTTAGTHSARNEFCETVNSRCEYRFTPLLNDRSIFFSIYPTLQHHTAPWATRWPGQARHNIFAQTISLSKSLFSNQCNMPQTNFDECSCTASMHFLGM